MPFGPQPLGPGRWAIVMDDSSRARLRDALEDLGWDPDELDLPMFEAHGREEHPVAPPEVGGSSAMNAAEPQSLRWLSESLAGVEPGSARFLRVLRRFVERAQDEGAEVAQSDEGHDHA